MLIQNKNKKAFTIIELIVVMVIIGILVLLAVPKFMNYTKEAKFTKLVANTKQIEKASERYYMDKNDWPRLSDIPYTSAEISTFTQTVYDNTGKEVILDTSGSYYNIDYDKLSQYIKVHDDKLNYIIQNPVGDVFYLDGLSTIGEVRTIPNDKPIAVITMAPDTGINPLTNITWSPVNSTDPNSDEIINVEWSGKQSVYSTAGTYTVKLRVQDSKGMWSDWVQKSFNVVKSGLQDTVPTGWIGVYTVDDLNSIRNNMAGKYILMKDIDLNIAPYNTGVGWSPIGTSSLEFTGQIDGNGYDINNLYINRPTETNVALIRVTRFVVLKNINLNNVNITGTDYTGALTSRLGDTRGIIQNCTSSGIITGTTNTGGIAGGISQGNMILCSSSATVAGTENVGGLVGTYSDSDSSKSISKCFSTGRVTGTNNVGGIVGEQKYSTVKECYSSAIIVGQNNTGGISGYVTTLTYSPNISNCYFNGSVTGTSNVGGILGYANTDWNFVLYIDKVFVYGTVNGASSIGSILGRAYTHYTTNTNVYILKTIYNSDFSSYPTVSSSFNTNIRYYNKGETTENMKLAATYDGYDFVNIWSIQEGLDYPHLKWETQ